MIYLLKNIIPIFLLIIFVKPINLYPFDKSSRKILAYVKSMGFYYQNYTFSYLDKNKLKKDISGLIDDILHTRDNEKNRLFFKKLDSYPATEVLACWIKALEKTNSPSMKVNIIDYLTRYNNRRIVLPVAKHLIDSNQSVRKSAARALKKTGDDRLYPIILRMAESSNPVHRIYFIEAMHYVYDRRFYIYLTNMLRDKNKSIRIYVLNCLGKNRLTESLGLIRNAALRDINDEVKITAIETIGIFRDRNSLHVLHRTLNNENRDVRYKSAKSLNRIASSGSVRPLSSRLLLERDDEIKEIIIETLIQLRRVGDVRSLEKILLTDENSRLRSKSAHALGLAKNQRALKALILGLNDSNYRVRAEVCNSLGNYRGRLTLSNLLGILGKEPERYVKSAALYSIKKLNDRNAILSLFDLYSREKDPVFKDLLRNIIRELIKRYI